MIVQVEWTDFLFQEPLVLEQVNYSLFLVEWPWVTDCLGVLNLRQVSYANCAVLFLWVVMILGQVDCGERTYVLSVTIRQMHLISALSHLLQSRLNSL